MDAPAAEAGKVNYKSPRWVQAWFLERSRNGWKQKYKELKADSVRMKRHVADATKSREKWRQEALELRRRVQELEAQAAVEQEPTADFKKDGPAGGSRPR
jgi:predicted  nucleic acid-binding Zn-ribbon protein